MSDNGIVRVDLPDGEWWDIRVKGIAWREIKAVRAELAKAQTEGLSVDLDETLLLHFTDWTSKAGERTGSLDADKAVIGRIMDGLGDEDASHTVLLMDVVTDKLFPLFPGMQTARKALGLSTSPSANTS